jgi:hypothetical protein
MTALSEKRDAMSRNLREDMQRSQMARSRPLHQISRWDQRPPAKVEPIVRIGDLTQISPSVRSIS